MQIASIRLQKMEVKIIHNRLKEARVLRGYKSGAAFAEAFGIALRTYAHHEAGRRGLKRVQAQKYSAALGISLGWLLSGEGSLEPLEQVEGSELQMVCVLDFDYADILNEEQITTPESATEFIPVVHDNKNIIAFKYNDEDMNLEATAGSIIIVDYSERTPVDGMLGIFEIDNRIYFRKFRDSDGPFRLEPSSNAKFDTIYPDNNLKVLGKVIAIQRVLS